MDMQTVERVEREADRVIADLRVGRRSVLRIEPRLVSAVKARVEQKLRGDVTPPTMNPDD